VGQGEGPAAPGLNHTAAIASGVSAPAFQDPASPDGRHLVFSPTYYDVNIDNLGYFKS
jgi:hypothetical protein